MMPCAYCPISRNRWMSHCKAASLEMVPHGTFCEKNGQKNHAWVSSFFFGGTMYLSSPRNLDVSLWSGKFGLDSTWHLCWKQTLRKNTNEFHFFLVPCNSAVQAAWQVSLQGGKFRNGSTWYLLWKKWPEKSRMSFLVFFWWYHVPVQSKKPGCFTVKRQVWIGFNMAPLLKTNTQKKHKRISFFSGAM